MGVSIYKIKKWYKMLTGQSITHVNQGVGLCYSKDAVSGYYNDLTEKITRDDPSILVPKYYMDNGQEMFFSIGIFQYGLAAYDLYLKTQEQIYLDKLLACSDWAVENQQEDGGWKTFAHENPEQPYSSMAQGEGISMLIRAHLATGEAKYRDAAVKAKEFMLIPLSEGGTTNYQGGDVFFHEYAYCPLVLNGWIFSLWGLYDYCKFNADEQAQKVLEATLETLKKKLPEFDTGYWSMYEDGKRICSPFYHDLHIAQLTVMYDLFGDEIYNEFAQKWDGYRKNFWNPKWAFVKKAWQKVME